MSYIHECRLEIPVLPADADGKKPEQYTPRLVFTRTLYGDTELLVEISAWLDDDPKRDRWVVQFYPPDQTDLAWQKDEGDWTRRRWPRKWDDPGLGPGELREPRDSAAAAIKRSIELLVDIIPQADRAAMEKVANILRPVLEQTTRTYQLRFRPTTRT